MNTASRILEAIAPFVLQGSQKVVLPRDAMHSADYAVARCPCPSFPLSVCLSVCPSHAGILSKRLNIYSNLFHHFIIHHSSFSVPNSLATEASNTEGV